MTCGTGVRESVREPLEGFGEAAEECLLPEYTIQTQVCVLRPCGEFTREAFRCLLCL